MADLHAASSQWSNRPADERFWSLAELHSACIAARDGSAVERVPFNALRATAESGTLQIVDPSCRPAHLTHYAFGQLAGVISAPSGYLRALPPHVAVQCLNAGLDRADEEGRRKRDLLYHTNGCRTLRACLSERYERVWDADLCAHLRELESAGWRAPAGRMPQGYTGPSRAARASDILPGQINIAEGQPIVPSGYYGSDHDLFAFLVAPDRVIGTGADTMMRGVFVRNSEVGDACLSFTFFLMQAVCGNHIVWGAQGVHEVRVRHVGGAPLRRALREFQLELRRYHDAAPEEERLIQAARKVTLGATKDEVIASLVKYCKGHSIPLSEKRISEGYALAEKRTDWYGDPRTLWANVAGLTEASQLIEYSDDRSTVDRAASRLLAMVN